MPSVFVDGESLEFDRCVVKRNGYVVGIDDAKEHANHAVKKHHFPPQRVSELEGDVSYER